MNTLLYHDCRRVGGKKGGKRPFPIYDNFNMYRKVALPIHENSMSGYRQPAAAQFGIL